MRENFKKTDISVYPKVPWIVMFECGLHKLSKKVLYGLHNTALKKKKKKNSCSDVLS